MPRKVVRKSKKVKRKLKRPKRKGTKKKKLSGFLKYFLNVVPMLQPRFLKKDFDQQVNF